MDHRERFSIGDWWVLLISGLHFVSYDHGRSCDGELGTAHFIQNRVSDTCGNQFKGLPSVFPQSVQRADEKARYQGPRHLGTVRYGNDTVS